MTSESELEKERQNEALAQSLPKRAGKMLRNIIGRMGQPIEGFDDQGYNGPDDRLYSGPDDRAYSKPEDRAYSKPEDRAYSVPEDRSFSKQLDGMSIGPEGRRVEEEGYGIKTIEKIQLPYSSFGEHRRVMMDVLERSGEKILDTSAAKEPDGSTPIAFVVAKGGMDDPEVVTAIKQSHHKMIGLSGLSAIAFEDNEDALVSASWEKQFEKGVDFRSPPEKGEYVPVWSVVGTFTGEDFPFKKAQDAGMNYEKPDEQVYMDGRTTNLDVALLAAKSMNRQKEDMGLSEFASLMQGREQGATEEVKPSRAQHMAAFQNQGQGM